MSRLRLFQTVALLVVLLIGGFVLYHRQEIKKPADLWALVQRDLGSLALDDWWASKPAPISGSLPARIKVASFKLAQQPGPLPEQTVLEIVADLCLDFDLIAIQLNQPDPAWSAALHQTLMGSGQAYQLVQDNSQDGYLILYNPATIILDAPHAYSVNDPDNLFEHPPLVAWFRAARVPAEAAFTFSLANYQVPAGRLAGEAQYLDPLFRAIRKDGRGEDDILIAGDFLSSPSVVDAGPVSPFRTVSQTHDTGYQQPTGKFLLHPAATIEVGREGTIQPHRLFNLTLAEAQQIWARNPVWIEFSLREGIAPEPLPDSVSPFPRRSRPQEIPTNPTSPSSPVPQTPAPDPVAATPAGLAEQPS